MRNKRILHLIGDLNPGGAEIVVVSLTKMLKAFNINSIICTRAGGCLIQRLDGIPFLILPKNRVLDASYLLRLCNFILKCNIDIIHAHLFGNNFYGLLAGLITRKRVILTIHGEECLNSMKRKIFYRLLAPLGSKIVTVSIPLYRKFLEGKYVKKRKVCLITNGIDIINFDKGIDPIQIKRKLGISLERPIIGSIGNIRPVKGYDILLNAAVHVTKKVPEACFIIVGGVYQYGSYFRKLKALRIEKGLQDKIYFLGKRDDVRDILNIFDIYVLPSRSEGTSMSLLEAMVTGKPIIATKVGGTVDIIKNCNTGLLVPPEDSFSLAMAIIKLLENQSLAKNLGKRAQQFARKEFNINSMVEKYVALYDEVLNS